MSYKISKYGVQWGSEYTPDNGELRELISEKYPILSGEDALIWSPLWNPLIGDSQPVPLTGILHPEGTELNIAIITDPETYMTNMRVRIVQDGSEYEVSELGILIPNITNYQELKEWFLK